MMESDRIRRFNERGNESQSEVNRLVREATADILEVSREEADLLRANAEVKVKRPARENGFMEIQPIGFSRIFSTPRVVTRADSDWVILPADQDPLYQQGQLAAKPEVRERIRDMLNAGVRVDYIAIAHQVQKGALAKVRSREELQSLIEPPMPKSLTVLSQLIRAATLASLKGAKTTSSGIALAGSALVAALAALPAKAAVDPIIFGAVVAKPPAKDGDAALFFMVARWDY